MDVLWCHVENKKNCFNILKIKPQNKSIISGLWVTYGIDVPFSGFD